MLMISGRIKIEWGGSVLKENGKQGICVVCRSCVRDVGIDELH